MIVVGCTVTSVVFIPVEGSHTLSTAKIFSLNVTVPGCYPYCYGDIQSVSHYIDYCLGRLDVLISCIHG